MPKKFTSKTVRKREDAHPRSRKAHQLQRATLREEYLHQKKSKQIKGRMYPIVDKLTWFQMRLDGELERCSVEYIDGLVEEYLARFDDELAEIKSRLRPDRPSPSSWTSWRR